MRHAQPIDPARGNSCPPARAVVVTGTPITDPLQNPMTVCHAAQRWRASRTFCCACSSLDASCAAM